MDVVDEILSAVPNAGELGISWQLFGSNGQEKADYSKGVLERFTRRASNFTNPITFCKFVSNPRTISFMDSPHCAFHFEGIFAINENKEIKPHPPWNIIPPLTEKIAVNHYHCKSWEEYKQKAERGYAPDLRKNMYTKDLFDKYDLNDEFDDGILKYREERAKVFKLPDKSFADARLLTALAVNLAPALLPNTPQDFYAGKMETFLTCRAVSAYLKTKLKDATPAEFYEEAALKAILKTLSSGASMADARLLISELPNLLTLPYPVIEELRGTYLNIVQQMLDIMRLNNRWKDFNDLDYLQRLLQTWK